MRTTLTLDDDLAGILKARAAEEGRPFKEVVNLALRRGLQDSVDRPVGALVRTVPFASGLRTGIDPDKLNQLADQLEVEAVTRETRCSGD